MAAQAQTAKSPRQLEREWWIRTVRVLRRPRAVFEALRDDSAESAAAMQEPLTALVFLSGISVFLSTSTAGRLFDDFEFDALLVAVESIVAGLLVALQNYWVVGGALALGIKGAEGEESYRQARHIVAFATAPFVVSLALVWPVRLAIFRGDLFASGGSDSGTGGAVFRAIDVVFLLWALALLVLGVRTVHEWSWRRSLAASALTAVFVALAVALFVVL